MVRISYFEASLGGSCRRKATDKGRRQRSVAPHSKRKGVSVYALTGLWEAMLFAYSEKRAGPRILKTLTVYAKHL